MKNEGIEPASPEIEALLASERNAGEANPYLRRRAVARATAVVTGSRPDRAFRRGFWYGRVTVVAGATVLLTALSAAAFVMLKKDPPAPPELEHAQANTPWKSRARRAVVLPRATVESPASMQPTASVAAASVAPPIARDTNDTGVPVPAVHSAKPRAVTTRVGAARVEHTRVTAARAAAPPASVLAENYARELKVLQPAREAVTRGDFATALAAVANHENGFPDGQLREEREALRVRSLIGLHRSGEARAVALTFHKRYPRSVLLSPMQDALEKNP